MDGKIQSYDVVEMVPLELALHFFFLYLVDVFKIYMRAHLNFFFKTYFS
jgi:hypothetical protein